MPMTLGEVNAEMSPIRQAIVAQPDFDQQATLLALLALLIMKLGDPAP